MPPGTLIEGGARAPKLIRSKNLGVIRPDGCAEILRVHAVAVCPALKPRRPVGRIDAPALEDRGIDRLIYCVGDVGFRFHRRRADFPVIAAIQFCDPVRAVHEFTEGIRDRRLVHVAVNCHAFPDVEKFPAAAASSG